MGPPTLKPTGAARRIVPLPELDFCYRPSNDSCQSESRPQKIVQFG